MSLHPLSLACTMFRNRAIQHLALGCAKAIFRAEQDLAADGRRTSLGSARIARKIERQAALRVPAYRDFSRQGGLISDKAQYIRRYPMPQLMANDWHKAFTIFRSSGSSGNAQYWPQLKDSHRPAQWGMRILLENCFEIHRRKTIAIVGLSLGSWVGGDHLSWVLKCVAMSAPYPLCVFSPGNHHDEIIDMIGEVQDFTDQIVLFVCPSAIGHLQLLAEQRGRALPLQKLRYVVVGEPFPESFRLGLMERAGIPAERIAMISIYGSADTGTLGIESNASIALRQLLALNPALRDETGFEDPVPHLFHFAAPDAYLEDVNGELCVTRWQGIPLVRYNLHDAVRFFDWDWLRNAVLRSSRVEPGQRGLLKVIHESSSALPSVLAIAGRADRCLILCGTNLTEAMLDSAVGSEALQPFLTGMYRARIEYGDERQRLAFDLETKPDAAIGDQTIYEALIEALGRVQPEFLQDWRNIYRRFDTDRDSRILHLRYKPWPVLSQAIENQPKQCGVRP